MSNVENVIKNLFYVSQAAKDEVGKQLATVVQTKKINLAQNEIVLLMQIVNAAIDSSFNNAIPVVQKEIEFLVNENKNKKK